MKAGDHFGNLTALEPVEFTGSPSSRRWLFRCVCNRQHVASAKNVSAGRTQNCKTCASKLRAKHATFTRQRTSSHIRQHPLYNVWWAMLQRCYNPNSQRYHRYGARGIIVCPQWHKFRVFLRDMGERPTTTHSIDRINNDGNYEPNNCKWSTPTEQANNRSK